MSIIYIIISGVYVIIFSLLSGAVVFLKKKYTFSLQLPTSFAVGSFLGVCFFYLLPQIYSQSFPKRIAPGIFIVGGIILFFTLEIIFGNHHSHLNSIDDKNKGKVVFLPKIFYNFLNGLFISCAYLLSIPAGVLITLAVLFHEIPQKIGNMNIYLRNNYSYFKSIFINFSLTSFFFVGVLFAWLLVDFVRNNYYFLWPLICANFLYIAGCDLIPELQHHSSEGSTAGGEVSVISSLKQLFFIALGVVTIYLFKKIIFL